MSNDFDEAMRGARLEKREKYVLSLRERAPQTRQIYSCNTHDVRKSSAGLKIPVGESDRMQVPVCVDFSGFSGAEVDRRTVPIWWWHTPCPPPLAG